MLDILKQAFFPGGRSVMGKVNKFHFTIGDLAIPVVMQYKHKIQTGKQQSGVSIE